MAWTKVAGADLLADKGRVVVRAGAKQIAVFLSGDRIFACNNRCPHEGYPLSEATLADGCVLTCNWHNWKFDLDSGETLVGGDRLRRYPVKIEDGAVWLDLTDPPAEQRIAAALDNLKGAVEWHEYDRMARAVARLQLAGGDPLEAVRQVISWTHDRPEFGTTHAIAAAPDWLLLRTRQATGSIDELSCVLEVLGHLSWDIQGEPVRPFPTGTEPWEPSVFLAAIEREDETAAIARMRGALSEGLGYADLERPLTEAALAHYQDFGHSLIYVVKVGELIDRLGRTVEEPLLLALVRSVVYASREDLIPEFRHYADRLARWDGSGRKRVSMEDFIGRSITEAMDATLAASADPDRLYHALLGTNAWNLLHFDMERQYGVEQQPAQNVNWLDFTHGVTFANATRRQCRKFPDLWPKGLLQMACFAGRNAAFTDGRQDVCGFRVTDVDAFFDGEFGRLLDHGEAEYIVSAHHLKLLTAVHEEIRAAPDAPWCDDLLAGANRFLHSPMRRKHVRRTAHQALSFVAAEG